MEKNEIDAYDIIVDVNSLEYLPNGWDVKYSEAGIDRYNDYKTKKSCVVGVVGNANKGKSFFLQKLSGIDLPSGHSVRTEGLSVKYPDMKDKNIILLDTAGLETPLKESNYYNPEEKRKEIEEEEEEEKKNNEKGESDEKGNGNEEESEEQIETKKKQEEEEKQLKVIERFARDKQITEFFLQRFILKNSNVLLLLVGQLTYSDQKLLNRVKRECTDKKLIVVHNLYNLIYKKQVEDYIEETLMKSLTFKLKKNKIISFDDKPKEDENTFYYCEEFNKGDKDDDDDDNGDDDNLDVVHIVMANDNSEAGNYYNKAAIKFVQNQITCMANLETFDVIDKLIKFFVKTSPDIIEEKINKDEMVFEDRLIKTTDDKKIKLKKCLTDELGFSSFKGSQYIPKYRHYINKDKTRFVIDIELPGKIEGIKVNSKIVEGNYLFKITGKKSFDVPKNSYSFISREKGNFDLNIKVPISQLDLKNTKIKEKKKENGIISLMFELNPKKEVKEDDDDE